MSKLETPEHLSIDQILGAFSHFDGTYKRKEVDLAIANREAIVPRLIEVLEGAVSDPERFEADDTCFVQVYALMLLGHFREPRAHRAIIALSSLPGDLSHRLLGDTISEDLAAVLLRTCNGSFEAIKGLVRDRTADDYCRAAAATAITYGVAEGTMLREDALRFLGGLLEEGMADPSGAFFDLIACRIHDLCPEGLMERIEEAYHAGLIHDGHIGPDAFERARSRGEEACLLDLKTKLERSSMDDLHQSMSWWACFQQRVQQPVSPKSASKTASRNRRRNERQKLAKAARKRRQRKKR